MSEPTSFTLFPFLLPEIRLLIWEYAIQPRIITFQCSLYNFNIQDAPQTIYLVGGDPPYEHFEIGIPQRPTSPYYLVQCYPPIVASPPLLSTCHESREVALRCGYKPWRIENEARGTRNLMWNPRLDVISLETNQRRRFFQGSCIDVLVELFPEEVKEIRNLIFETIRWPPGEDENLGQWTKILRFSNLRQLAVLVESHDRRLDFMLKHAADGVRKCLAVAKDLQMKRLDAGSTEYLKLAAWFPSNVQVVDHESDILN
ncbi:hypothetical protein NA56DRAFT_328219 [Hyaloscypha hepaticicola]|uniref:2EXR domain-containing protein n=1 Tax=Hyaloscypha hepaticicola TaxID=2082293 RepID=A0A2J6PPD2_9HELO|nr:hypothetical protein NA56DRAFT_328219 [Hyaloscypha hepaticicola]